MSRRTFYLIVNIIKEYEEKKNKPGRPCTLIPEEQVLIAIQYWREYRTYLNLADNDKLNIFVVLIMYLELINCICGKIMVKR